jgi:hypothetical protein
MTHDSPSKTFASTFRKPSAWDVVYSINMGIACMIAYAITTSILVPASARDDDLLGGMWAAVATAFVFRDTRAHSLSSGVARFIATCVSFALCWLYLRILPPTAVGIPILVTVGTLVMMGFDFLTGRPTGRHRGRLDGGVQTTTTTAPSGA